MVLFTLPSYPDYKCQFGFSRYIVIASFASHTSHANLTTVHLPIFFMIGLGSFINEFSFLLSQLKWEHYIEKFIFYSPQIIRVASYPPFNLTTTLSGKIRYQTKYEFQFTLVITLQLISFTPLQRQHSPKTENSCKKNIFIISNQLVLTLNFLKSFQSECLLSF